MSERLTGHVTAVGSDRAGRYADVAVETSACQRCASGRGCGAALFSGTRGTLRVRIEPGSDGVPLTGDEVVVATSGHSLLRASATVYGLPLSGLIAGALLAAALSVNDIVAVALSLAGLAAGWMVARARAQSVCIAPTLKPVQRPGGYGA